MKLLWTHKRDLIARVYTIPHKNVSRTLLNDRGWYSNPGATVILANQTSSSWYLDIIWCRVGTQSWKSAIDLSLQCNMNSLPNIQIAIQPLNELEIGCVLATRWLICDWCFGIGWVMSLYVIDDYVVSIWLRLSATVSYNNTWGPFY